MLEHVFALWRLAAERTGGEPIGVRLAAFADPSAAVSWPMPLSLFERLGRCSATLGDAVALIDRFQRLLRDGLRTMLEIQGDRAVLYVEMSPDEPSDSVEFNLAAVLIVARRITGAELLPREVWFAHRAPAHVGPHAKVFKSKIRWCAPFTAAIFCSEDFTRPLPTANEQRRARMIRHAELLLGALPGIALLADDVCAEIEAALPYGNTNAESIAARLHVSSRTLHRKLRQEGTSFQTQLDRVRFRLALRHLAAGKAITEVAVHVGFASVSTFHRAFKEWTGETPATYLERRLHVTPN